MFKLQISDSSQTKLFQWKKKNYFGILCFFFWCLNVLRKKKFPQKKKNLYIYFLRHIICTSWWFHENEEIWWRKEICFSLEINIKRENWRSRDTSVCDVNSANCEFQKNKKIFFCFHKTIISEHRDSWLKTQKKKIILDSPEILAFRYNFHKKNDDDHRHSARSREWGNALHILWVS